MHAINALGIPLEFKKQKHNDEERKEEEEETKGRNKSGSLMMIGEIGNGKSTTGNYLMQCMEMKMGKDPEQFDINNCFESG